MRTSCLLEHTSCWPLGGHDKKLQQCGDPSTLRQVDEEPHSDEGCFAATATIQGIRMLLARCLDKRDQGHEAFVADYTQAFLNAEVLEGEHLYAQPLEGGTRRF